MQTRFTRFSIAAALLAAVAAPAFAGNYAEGDPRPVAFTSSVSSASVAADTRAWMASAPTVGYPEGNPREVAQVGQNSRAAVVADTMNWIKSGLAATQFGESGADMSNPKYRQAANAYATLRGTGSDTRMTQSPATGAAQVR